MKGYIHSTETFGAVDGPGLRYVVFMQGCPYRCIYCHNPDSWKVKNGKLVTVKDIIKQIKPYLNYIKTGGVTISGGEPMLQAGFVYKLTKELHKLNVHVAIDTAGSLSLTRSKKVIDEADMLLLDIKALDNDLHKVVTGHPNANNRAVLNYCESIGKPIWIRHVLVPEYTLDFKKLKELAKFLKGYKCVQNIELLPYHSMGEFKWKDLGIEQKPLKTPTPSAIEKARAIFKKENLPVK